MSRIAGEGEGESEGKGVGVCITRSWSHVFDGLS